MSNDGYDDCMYPPTRRSVSAARRRTAEVVNTWGYPEVSGDAALLVSELATNAVQHGMARGRLFRVEVAVGPTALRVAVTDARGERAIGAPRAAGPEDERGRGLAIVAGLAARWDVQQLAVGKRVWAELDLPGQERREHRDAPEPSA